MIICDLQSTSPGQATVDKIATMCLTASVIKIIKVTIAILVITRSSLKHTDIKGQIYFYVCSFQLSPIEILQSSLTSRIFELILGCGSSEKTGIK